MSTDADVVVVGAGISGLATAFGLQRRGHNVAVLEQTQRAGGVIGSRRRDGFLYETGPNSTLDSTPLIGTLLHDLGIQGERIDANAIASTRYIVRSGKLVALPLSPAALFKSPAFSMRAKLRLLREPFIARGASAQEESIAAFVRRRLGSEFLDYAIDPFVAGIYAGDPEEISVAAAFPRLMALEQKHGSLIRGQIAGARERRANPETAKNVAASFSFRNGMQTVTDSLAQALQHIVFDTQVEAIARGPQGTSVVHGMSGGAPMSRHARAVVIAAPAYAAAKMIEAIAPQAAEAIGAIQYAPIAGTASAYRRADVAHSLAGFGFLVPRKERRRILGSLFSSSMFAGRAPDDSVLLTTFTGGRRNLEVTTLSDMAVARVVREELASLLGATAQPLWQEVVRWPQAIAQYTIGHLDRLRHLDAAEAALPGLYFCANYRGGVSVGDCIKSAHATVEKVDRALRA